MKLNRKNYNVKHLNKTSKDYPISDDNINDIVGIDNKIFIATKNPTTPYNDFKK